MGDKDDYLTSYRVFFENFAATVDPEDQLPVNIAGYTITESELPGEVIYWTTQYLTEKQCPLTLMTYLQRIILDEVRIASKKHPNEFGYNSDDSEFIALRLMQAVTARVNDVCLRYLDNARLDTLPPPPPQSFKEYKTVSSATKNSRRVMEDRHVEIGNLEALFGIETTEPTSFYAVYDGHAGSAAATYCAAHLHQYLVESPHFTRDLRQATHDAYLRTDAEFIRKSNQKRASGGSTAVSVAVRGRRLVAAWAGDSQALLAKRMRLMQLVNPHKPDRLDEKERIESSGGTVMYWGTWRVNGQLAVSRAIGDAQYKPYVTARPEIAVVELDGDEDFVVVACDGLWDVLSEDAVALSVYKQIINDPDDLKAVPKNLVRQAKRDGSEDNISVIVVFLKDPRDIVADNYPPMDLGLDNAVVNVPPFALENEACKTVVVETGAANCAEGGDNGVSDSDSDDLGPETAVDADLDVDDDAELRDEPAPPTPPAHAVESSHVDGNLVDNVAESGEESEDEWNYFKGEGEREQIPSEEADDPPRSDTPGQDNSAWESSSVDMNSSPLNPDAPVFVPGGVAGSDVLLAESPRKPMPMDDIEVPDGNQFQSEAVVRPAEIQDMDNCDQRNGHHNISMEGVTEHLNGHEKDELESLGFGFNVGIEQEKKKDTTLIHDFERIQKDTTDFCNIQVFQAHTETNPFNTDGDDELFERLKNKERDPMSMSFYQEKDDDTCERFGKMEPCVDLNAVQPLPDSDDEDMQPNGIYQSEDKENVCPREKSNFFNLEEDGQEPNNDIMRFDDVSADTLANNITNLDNFMDFNVNSASNIQNDSNTEFECNIQLESVAQTDTPESHKLLFEQIPEIPDGKSSELGFTNEDLLDPSESEKDVRAITPQDETSQDIEMESKHEESPSEEVQPEISGEVKDDLVQSEHQDISETTSDQVEQLDNIENEIITESETTPDLEEKPIEQFSKSPEMAHGNVIVDVHKNPEPEINNFDGFEAEDDNDMAHGDIKESSEFDVDSEIRLQAEQEIDNLQAPVSQMRNDSPVHSPALSGPLITSDSPLCASPAPKDDVTRESPAPQDTALPETYPLPQEVSVHPESPFPLESPLPSESPVPSTIAHVDTLEATESHLAKSPLPTELEVSEPIAPAMSPLLTQSQLPTEDALEPLVPAEIPLPQESPLPSESPLPDDAHVADSNVLSKSPLPSKPVKKHPSGLDRETRRRIKLRTRQKVEAQLSLLDSDTMSDFDSTDSDTASDMELPVDSSIDQRDTQIESQIKSQIDSQQILEFERGTFVPDNIQQESPIAVDNVESQQNVEEPIHRSPLPVEQNIEETFSREQHQELSAVMQVADETSEPPSESPLPIETSLQEAIHIEPPVCEHLRDSPLPNETLTDSPLPVEQPVSPLPVEPLRDSPLPIESMRDSPVPVEPISDSPLPVEPLRDSPLPVEPLRDSPLPVELAETGLLPMEKERPESVSPAPVETITSLNTSAPAETVADTYSIAPADQTTEVGTLASAETIAPVEEIAVVTSSAPLIESDFEVIPPQEPVMKSEQLSEISAPAPDIVPEERSRNELVTDIDIGIPESRAQEICVPVTSEIQHEDAVRPGATPPLTPAGGDAPIAAAVVATAAVAATVVAAAAKSSSPKKSPTTPTAKLDSKATTKTTAARTPASTKRISSATTAARSPATTAARTPAARTPIAKASPAAPRSAAKPISSPAKTAVPAKTAAAAKPASTLAAKPAPRAAAATAPRATTAPRAPPAPRPVPKAPAAKPATAPPKAVAAAAKSTAAATAKPAARPPPITRPPAKSAPIAPITKPKEVKPKAPGPPLPMTNGDVKMTVKAAPAARAPISRPAPRAAPRPAAAVPARTAAPKPAARAPLDKQSKDLANKRITAKAAPPRTVTHKAPVGIKGTRAVKKLDNKEKSEKALTNGASDESCKAPPSPPADSLLPDVIA